MKHRILLTGATGAIGMMFLRQMASQGRLNEVAVLIRDSKKNRKKLREFGGQIQVFYGDITNQEAVERAVLGKEVVIHLAALIPTVESSNNSLVSRVNIQGTEILVKTMEQTAPNAFLLFSSSVAIYGDRIKEPFIQINDPLLGVEYDHYSYTKVEAEKIIKASTLRWSIFRLSAIMGIGNHKISGIMFQVPLATPMEIATVKDTAHAFLKAIDHQEALNRMVFNLAGGERCRITYEDFMKRAFHAYGLGKLNFPKHAFAFQNFHCGYFLDADQLEDILQFRSDTIDSYFERFHASVPAIQRMVTRPTAGIVKYMLTRLSEPLKAYKSGDRDRISFFFGEDL